MTLATALIFALLGQAAPQAVPPTPTRVGGSVKEPRKLKHVAPKYPADARRAGLMQAVVLECVVDPRGAVGRVDVRQGVPPLTDAAIEAVRQWRYEPTLLDGVPVPVIMTVTVNFVLSETRYYDLLGSLDNENEQIRAAAARNLGVLRVGGAFDEGDRKRTIRALERLASEDPSPLVRAAAVHSLTRLDGRPPPPGWQPPLRAPAAPASTTRALGFGVFTDPLGQCAARVDVDRIQIEVPGRPASIEQGQEWAPRLMQPVVGDFAAEVRAGSLPQPLFQGRAFHSAGLLLRKDEGNLVRLESALISEPGFGPQPPRAVRYVLLEARQDGRALDTSPVALTLTEGPVDLRLERRGGELLALVSQQGEKWREVARLTLALPREMEVGVTAVNTGGATLSARLRGFVVSKTDDRVAERPLLPPEPAPPPAAARPVAPPLAPADSDPWPVVATDTASDRPVVDDAMDSPPRVLQQARPEYPQAAYAQRIEGTVLVEALIDTKGRVTRARVLQSVPGLDEAALKAVMKWRFRPALKNGKAVATIVHMPVAFRIY